MNKNYIIFFGPPGSGKGTQAKLTSDLLKLPVISTGDLLRKEIELKTSIGQQAEELMSQGKYVPNELVEELLVKRLELKDAKLGAIFDGYPRLEVQQEFLLKLQKKNKMLAVLVAVSDKEIKNRLSGRRACICGQVYHLKFKPAKNAGHCDVCGKKLFIRNDDKPAVIKARLNIYHEQTEPLTDYWRTNQALIEVDGEQSMGRVFSDIKNKLKK